MKELLTLFAQKIDTGKAGIEKIEASDILANGLNLVYFIGGAVAVLVIIFAGIRYVTSTGNPDGVKKAQNMLLYAVIGLVIIAIAFTITQFVIGVF